MARCVARSRPALARDDLGSNNFTTAYRWSRSPQQWYTSAMRPLSALGARRLVTQLGQPNRPVRNSATAARPTLGTPVQPPPRSRTSDGGRRVGGLPEQHGHLVVRVVRGRPGRRDVRECVFGMPGASASSR